MGESIAKQRRNPKSLIGNAKTLIGNGNGIGIGIGIATGTQSLTKASIGA
jgi:hypothetical protein